MKYSSSRRKFIRNSFAAAVGSLAGLSFFKSYAGENSSENSIRKTVSIDAFTLPALPYAYDALEPVIDKQTMELHHSKHHQSYVDNLNKALKESNLSAVSLEEMFANISKYPAAIRNNGGGHWNHSFFWNAMKPGGDAKPEGKLADAIKSKFGSFENFQIKFNDAAKNRFGSGWAWLISDKNGKLEIGSTANQDNPLMDMSDLKGKPILALDVWEHAYYLKYQNKRAEYVTAWWKAVNWDEAMKNYSPSR